MEWVFIAAIILLGEFILIAIFWESFAVLFASYPVLLDMGEKALQNENLGKAKRMFARVINHQDFQALGYDHPMKAHAFQRLATVLQELAEELLVKQDKDYGQQYYTEALLYKVKELEHKGEWDGLKEKHPEIRALRLHLAEAYSRNKARLPEAVDIFFEYNEWHSTAEVFDLLKKQLSFINMNQDEKELLEQKATLAKELVKYKDGVEKIMNGKKEGKRQVENALEEISTLIATNGEYLHINEPVFNEVKEKLGHHIVAEIQGRQDELLELEVSDANADKVIIEKERNEQLIKEANAAKSWKVIIKQLQAQSRVIADVKEKPGEVIVEVLTEWYLLPLIFQEELVEKLAKTYYTLSKKKNGTISFIFKDNKGREVARHTQLGTRIYN
ncbi:MAG: hypothetical protein SCK28_13995 [Bacillota bacterium]|nr:hypothetical protein [Bacillota bacterium]